MLGGILVFAVWTLGVEGVALGEPQCVLGGEKAGDGVCG